MKLQTSSINVQSPLLFMLQASAPSPTSFFYSPCKIKKLQIFNHVRSRKFSRCNNILSCRSSSLDEADSNGSYCTISESILGIKPEAPNWPERESILLASVEQKAKSFGLPLSLRMIKKKKHQLEAGFVNFPELATSCSVSKAFSSMVFIIVELQSHALHIRESVCNEDLEVIIAKVQREMYASFVWLFQQVFSRTPALMIYVMILLANYSTSNNAGQIQVVRNEQERELWESIEDEALNMRGLKDFGLDHNVMLRFVSPLSVEIETDNNVDYFKTDLLYQMVLSKDPYNTLLLSNYAQFLQVIARDYNRVEECFKRAVHVEPADAEVLSQYANFLWTVKKDLWGAEERYQEAMAAEPRNPYYASTYANFLWSTGGEETCFLPTTSSFTNKKSEEV